MRIVQLGDVVRINPRLPKETAQKKHTRVFFLPMAGVSEEGKITTSEERELIEVVTGYRYFEKGDVLLAKITPCFENGKSVLVDDVIPYQIGFGSTEFHVLRASEIIDPHYLFYMVWNPAFRFVGERNMTGTAGQKRVPVDFLKKYKIPLPPLAEQKRIAAILDKADAIRRKRKAAIKLADDFLRATFLDMFGDPAFNPNQFDYILLSTLYSTKKPGTKCGPFGSALKKHEYVNIGIPVWTMNNIQRNEFVKNGCLFITEEKYRKLKAYSVHENDILISRAGTVGKMCIAKNPGNKSIISTNLIRLSLNTQKIEPTYFVCLISFFKGKVGRLKTGEDGSYSFMNTGILNQLSIPLPPLQLQKQFIDIVSKVKQIQGSKIYALDEIETLFNSLTQRVFREELL